MSFNQKPSLERNRRGGYIARVVIFVYVAHLRLLAGLPPQLGLRTLDKSTRGKASGMGV